MMKFVIFVTILLVATEICSVFGQDKKEEECVKFTNETECCASCIYITCQNKTGSETIKGCHAIGWDNSTNCNSTTAANTCPASGGSTTPAPADECQSFTTNDDCCANDKCSFISCTDKTDTTANHTGCHLKDADLTDVCEGNATKLCKPDTTTPPPTAAPTTATTDVCEVNKDKASCCGATESCIFINCTDPEDKPHQGCHVNTTDFANVCKTPDDKVNECAVTTTQAPTTQAPAGTTAATDACEAFTTQADCCDKETDLSCQYINCTMADSTIHEGCHKKDADVSSVCADTPVNQCPSAQPSSSTTAGPPAGEAAASKESGQKFDGASFIGGIVLTAGVVAIIFFGLKFYKARTERNYHTL